MLGDIGKRAVAVVAEHHAAAQSGAVDVDKTVVVEIACRHAHAVRLDIDPALLGDVGEVQRPRAVGVHDQVVPEQAILERRVRLEHRLAERLAAQHLSLHEVDVEVAVVIVIEQRDAGRHDFRIVELARHAVEVHEVEAGRFGAFSEPLNVRGTALRGPR